MSGDAETRSFTMHPKLLYDVILRQAGSLSKAVLEGVMNGVDARATRIDIEVTDEHVRITDDGVGFRSRADVEQYFESFGQPHAAEERKVFGTFRMGRGQMFAYGTNRWRTGEFKMEVDIKGRGLDYDLAEGLESHPGCDITIDLYEPLLPSDLASLERELKRQVKYVSLPVTLNGHRISTDPSTEKWDHETDDAYVRLKDTGTLTVYNLGVFVTDLGAYRYGTGGEVVSKRQLKLNFARNDIQSDCPVWKRTRTHLGDESGRKIRRKTRLTDGEKEHLIEQIKAGERSGRDLYKLRFLDDVTGRSWSPDRLESHVARKRVPVITHAPTGDFRGDTLMQRGTAFVFASHTLDLFGVADSEALVHLLVARNILGGSFPGVSYLEFDEAARGLSSDHRIVDKADYRPREDFLMRFVQSIYRRQFQYREKPRRLLLGDSETSRAWTDGNSFIAIRRDFIDQADDVEGWLRLAQLILHELTHEDPTTDQHTHTPEFYRAYHDTGLDDEWAIGFVKDAIAHFPAFMARHDRSFTKKQLRTQDRLAKARRQRDEVIGQVEQLAALSDEVAETRRATRTAKKQLKRARAAAPTKKEPGAKTRVAAKSARRSRRATNGASARSAQLGLTL